VTIVGLGLVGGSLARALTRAGWSVVGIDDERTRRRARRAGAVSRTAADLKTVLLEAELLVLAAPPRANLRLLRLVAREAPGMIVTDVGSVKAEICAEAGRLGLAHFVGGHPMAGSTGSGFASSSADLFAGRAWILVKSASWTGSRPLAKVRRLVRATGAQPVLVSNPDEHDRAMAFLSHLPQIASWALREAAHGDPVALRHLALAGPGYRDMVRLAGSPRPLWSEIVDQNRANVRRALAALRAALAREEERCGLAAEVLRPAVRKGQNERFRPGPGGPGSGLKHKTEEIR
jgi:prephenate dehydrogenase